MRHFPPCASGENSDKCGLAVRKELNYLQHVCNIFDMSPSKCLQASPTWSLFHSRTVSLGFMWSQNEESRDYS